MKNLIKTNIKYEIGSISAIILLFIYFSLDSGRENISRMMDESLKGTIETDFYRRANQEISYQEKPLGRKVKEVKILTKKGSETIEFKDSIEEYLSDQLVTQYILADIHPIIPDEFNTLFGEELKKRGISCTTGIIYRHKGQTTYSKQDSVSLKDAIILPPVALDIKEAVCVQAWARCDRMELLRHSDPKEVGLAGGACILLALMAFLAIHRYKTRATSAIPKDTIRIDEKQGKVYIKGKECIVTQMGFLILRLLLRSKNHFATRQQIALVLWPNEKSYIDFTVLNNRIDKHINILRKTLEDFPVFQLETIKGQGYRLSFAEPK